MIFNPLMSQHEVDRNQELLGRLKKLEDREKDTARSLSEQMETNRSLRNNLDCLNRKLEERDSRLSSANQVHVVGYFWCIVTHLATCVVILMSTCLPDHQFEQGWDQRAETEDSKPRLDNFLSKPGKSKTAGTTGFTAQVHTLVLLFILQIIQD